MKFKNSAWATIFLSLSTQIFAASRAPSSFYVNSDPTLGNDARTETEASSANTPWRSLARLSQAVLVPGDRIFLKSGSKWRETLTLKYSGSNGLPIVISAYGSTANTPLPEITGYDSIVSTKDSSGIYSYQGSAPVKSIYTSDEYIPVAREPENDWITASAIEGDSVIIAPAAISGNPIGATLHLRTSPYTIESRKIEFVSGKRISLAGRMTHNPDSASFFFSNTYSAFTKSTTGWYYDSLTKKLLWKSPRLGQSAKTIEASTRQIGIDLGASSYIQINGIKISGTSLRGVSSTGSNILIDNCTFVNTGLTGVYSRGRDTQIKNCFFTRVSERAIFATGNKNVVLNNTITNTGILTQIGPDGLGQGCCGGIAIESRGDTSIIRRNVIDSTAYNGITFHGMNSFTDSNYVSNACLHNNDCGGIYTWTGNYDSVGAAGSVIRQNVINYGATNSANGIYLDDGSHHITVELNTVTNFNRGIFLHNTQNTKVTSNTLYGNRTTQIYLQHDELAGAEDMHTNIIQANQLITLNNQEFIQSYLIRPQTTPLYSEYSDISCKVLASQIRCVRNGSVMWEYNRPAPSVIQSQPETQNNYGFETKDLAWIGWPNLKATTIATASECGQSSQCMKVIHTTAELLKKPLINCGKKLAVAKDTWWQLSFKAKGLNPSQALYPTLRRTNGDYSVLASIPAASLTTNWSTFKFTFQANASEDSARLDFHNGENDSTYMVDDVSLKNVTLSSIDTLQGSLLLIGPRNTALLARSNTLSPSGVWIGTKQDTARDITVAPYNSLILFRKTSTLLDTKPTQPASIRIFKTGNAIRLEGVNGQALIYDAQGRILATLYSNSEGHAIWDKPVRCKPCWVKTDKVSAAINPFL